MTFRTGNRERGFSLIELLTVVAIIAILAAILFPVLANTKESGKRANCQSNLKQLALGTLLYVQDYSRYPRQPEDGVFDWGEPSSKPNWARSVEKYVKNARIPRCPSVTKASSCRTDCAMLVNGVSYPISYFGNGLILKDGLVESAVAKSSKTILFQCCGQAWNICWMAPTWNEEYGVWESYVHKSWAKHSGGSNLAFTDGHLKWMEYKDLVAHTSLFDPYK